MDEKSLTTLELSLVLERLARFAAFSASKELAHALRPTDGLEEARRRQTETSEARLLLSLKSDLTIGGAHDLRPQAHAASRGAVLEPVELLDLKSTLIAARRLRRMFEKSGDSYPVLSGIALKLEPSTGLIDAITKTLDEKGQVQDGASQKLATIRRDLRVARDRLKDKLQRFLADPKIAPLLQEPIITQRDGRFVIPLRAEFKGRIKAVIHDQSASGATLFVEPLKVVDLNNQVRELQLAEREEIRRILADLSKRVGEQTESIVRTVEALAGLDLAFAKALYAEAINATEPILKPFQADVDPPHPGSTLCLLAARHPLLDPKIVVPIDLNLDPDSYALVITGPNTGGKTVSLKTVGLLTLMSQCGLHIPVTSGSELSVFDGIHADIGDEQSIEQSLSTFSAHISNIIQIMGKATSRSLVVLDELGAGTDPQEGAALASAILGTILERGITTLVATHYPELKAFAYATPGVSNASVEFDMESLRPTYHLTVGLPGRSNALAIATRLGLDPEIVENARKMVSPDDLRTESLLEEIHLQRELAFEERIQAQEAREELQSLQAKLERRLEAIEDERRILLEQTQAKAEDELAEFHKQMKDLHRQLSAAAQPLEELKEIETEAKTLVGDIGGSLDQTPLKIENLERHDWSEKVRPFGLGDRVRLRTINAEGVITDISRDQVEVQVGRLRVRARTDELSHLKDLDQQFEPRKGESRRSTSRKGVITTAGKVPPLELDLRGQTVDESLEELERRLDAAYLVGMPFMRIIHGKGSGRLRQAIREALKDNLYVASFEGGKAGEGGDGVTVIQIATG